MPKKPLVGKPRRSTGYKVTLPLSPSVKVQPITVDLIQKQYKHDVLVLNYGNIYDPVFLAMQTGAPIKFEWQQGSKKKTWLGYVHSVTRQHSSQRHRPMQVRCVGASFVLKKKQNRVFKNATIPEVAAKIAKENGLRFVVDAHPRRFRQISINGTSYWEWLQENAKSIGYVVYIDDATLFLRRADRVIDASSSVAPVLQLWSNMAPKNEFTPDRTLDSFNLLHTEYDETGDVTRTTKTVAGVNPVTGKGFSKKTSPKKTGKKLRKQVNDVLFDEHQTRTVASDQLSAGYAANGLAQLARFNMPAKIGGQGDPQIVPFGLVNISGTSTATDGFWLVKEAHHHFTTTGEYQVNAVVLSDGLGGNNATGVRKDSSEFVGRINIDDVVANSGEFAGGAGKVSLKHLSLSKASNRSKTKLKVPGQVVFNKGQAVAGSRPGFNRTPARWQSKSPSKSGR